MRLYLSAVLEHMKKWPERVKDTNVLLSFAYFSDRYIDMFPLCKNLMFDSGAFTMMNKQKKNFDIMEYCKKYAESVKKYNIKDFIELDIEAVFGFDVYRDCLHQLQDITGRDPIYVFHKWRGLNYFHEIIKQKNYIALGDVSIPGKGGGSRELYKHFYYMVEEAHKNNCKVHGLAFTSIPDLDYILFDSIDSSSWLSADKFGKCFRFDGHDVQCYDKKKEKISLKVKDEKSCLLLNGFDEWKKLSQYFDSERLPIW